MANEVVREKAKEKGIRLWQIAARIGISDNEFSRRLRFELPEHQRQEALQIIDELWREKENGAN